METLAGPEFLDRLDGPADTVLAGHRDLEILNRISGGYGPIRAALDRASVRGEVLDVGAGTGGLLLRLGLCGSCGLDLHPVALRRLRARGLRGVRGDGRRLPFRDSAFEAAVSLLTLHHLDDAGALALLIEMRRVARRLVVVSDLSPAPGLLALARRLLPRLPVSEAVRFDFIASFERARPLEITRRIALQAGLAGASLRPLPLGRVLLEWIRS